MLVEDADGAISLIKDWIEQKGISNCIMLEPTPDDTYFQFNGTDKTEIPFLIVQPKEWKKTILILSEVAVTANRIKSIEAMKPKAKDEFLYNLYRDIAFLSAPYAFGPLDKTGIPTGIQFQREICYDGFTEDRLNKAVRDVVECVLFVIWRIRNEFGEPEE
jgi:hypothetical protein